MNRLFLRSFSWALTNSRPSLPRSSLFVAPATPFRTRFIYLESAPKESDTPSESCRTCAFRANRNAHSVRSHPGAYRLGRGASLRYSIRPKNGRCPYFSTFSREARAIFDHPVSENVYGKLPDRHRHCNSLQGESRTEQCSLARLISERLNELLLLGLYLL